MTQEVFVPNNEKKTTFVEGGTVNVWKKTGVRRLKYGVQTSERTGGDFPDIDESEELKVVKKLGSGKAVCIRPNGQEIIVHKNHVDKDAKYYAPRLAAAAEADAKNEAASEKGQTPQEKLHAAQDLMNKARREYDEALKQIEEVEAELSSQDLLEVTEEEQEKKA